MAIVRSNYTNSQPITITLASLADAATATSSSIDNSTDRFISADIQIKFKTAAGTTALGVIQVYIIRSADGGTTFDDSAINAEIIGAFNANTDTTTFIVSLDTALNGQLPDFWKIAVKNLSGAAFDATAGNFSVKFIGKKFEII